MEQMEISVQTLGGSVLKLSLHAAATIDNLHDCVAKLQGAHPRLFPLMVNGHLLDSHRRVRDVNDRFLTSHEVQHKTKLLQGFPRRNFETPEADVDYGNRVAEAYAWVCEAQDCGMMGAKALEQSMARLLVDAALEPDAVLLVDTKGEATSSVQRQQSESTLYASLSSIEEVTSPASAVSSRASPSPQRRAAPDTSQQGSHGRWRQVRNSLAAFPATATTKKRVASDTYELFVHTEVLGRHCKHFHWRRIVLKSIEGLEVELECRSTTRSRLASLQRRLDMLRPKDSGNTDAPVNEDTVPWLEVAGVLRQDLAESPKDANAWFNLGIACLSQWELDEHMVDLRAAAWALRRCVELNEHDSAALRSLYDVFQHLGDDIEASELNDLDQFRDELTCEECVENLLCLGTALLWRWRRSKENFEEAVKLFDRCLEQVEARLAGVAADPDSYEQQPQHDWQAQQLTQIYQDADCMRAIASAAAVDPDIYEQQSQHDLQAEELMQLAYDSQAEQNSGHPQYHSQGQEMMYGAAVRGLENDAVANSRAKGMQRAWLRTLSSQRGDHLRRLPVVLRVGVPPGAHLRVPIPHIFGLRYMLHFLYTPDEEAIRVTEIVYQRQEVNHTGDRLVRLVHCCLALDVRDTGTMGRLQRALHRSPSLVCLQLAERYNYCHMPRSRFMEDLRSFLMHTLSHFESTEIERFRGYELGDPPARVTIKDEIKLEILERRIRALEHVFRSSKAFSSSKTHFRTSKGGGHSTFEGGSQFAVTRKFFRDREGVRMMIS